MKLLVDKKFLFFLMALLMFFLFYGEYTEIIRATSLAYALDPPDMDMGASPNPVGSGARAMGMGGAFISIADDATAASWNPGGLPQLAKPEVSIVGSYLSGKVNYLTIEIEGDISDKSPRIDHLNYLSAVVPFKFCRRNWVFSFNFQHLYEFAMDISYTRREKDSGAMIDLFHEDYKHQKGTLNTISPALAIQIHPSFLFGITGNFWDKHYNGWENINIQDAKGTDMGYEKIRHSEIYERYDFSGFNMHLGFLYKSDYHILLGRERQFRIGGVLKTPFKADIRHKKRKIFWEHYPDNPGWSGYESPIYYSDLTLKMPLSYGVGFSCDFSDAFTISWDVYQTRWDQYILVDPNGDALSPISQKAKNKERIKPTTQIRMGAEYLFRYPKWIIPLRGGVFYDPEPSGDEPDDFYGVSFGSGISYREIFCFDFAYQYRFGKKRDFEYMQGESISCKVTQHYFYASIIYYLF